MDRTTLTELIELIRRHVRADEYFVTAHAHVELAEDGFAISDLERGVDSGRIIENYPEDRRGASCLVAGTASDGRPIHIVCTTESPIIIVITVYEPKSPKWASPTRRGNEQDEV